MNVNDKHPPAKLFLEGTATEIARWLKTNYDDHESAMAALDRCEQDLSLERRAVLVKVRDVLA